MQGYVVQSKPFIIGFRFKKSFEKLVKIEEFIGVTFYSTLLMIWPILQPQFFTF